jgi:hypothetical protein
MWWATARVGAASVLAAVGAMSGAAEAGAGAGVTTGAGTEAAGVPRCEMASPTTTVSPAVAAPRRSARRDTSGVRKSMLASDADDVSSFGEPD